MRFPNEFIDAVHRAFPDHEKLNLLVKAGSRDVIKLLEFLIQNDYDPKKTQELLRNGKITPKDAQALDLRYRNASDLREQCTKIIHGR